MQPIQPTGGTRRPYADAGSGWLTFSAVMLFLVGLANVFQGLVLVVGDEIYVTGVDAADVVIGDAATWGWVILVVGVLEMFAGAGVFNRNQLARWFGIVVASVALIVQFPVFFGANSLWSFMLVVMCVLVIYGLAVYGGREDVV